jgi:hypothetical protein
VGDEVAAGLGMSGALGTTRRKLLRAGLMAGVAGLLPVSALAEVDGRGRLAVRGLVMTTAQSGWGGWSRSPSRCCLA